MWVIKFGGPLLAPWVGFGMLMFGVLVQTVAVNARFQRLKRLDPIDDPWSDLASGDTFGDSNLKHWRSLDFTGIVAMNAGSWKCSDGAFGPLVVIALVYTAVRLFALTQT